MGAVIARLAARKLRSQGLLKVLYTAHGFHFFKGSPKQYWFMYYPMEKYLSKYTDAIITINQEDYDMVLSHNFKNRDTYKISGIGINTQRLVLSTSQNKSVLRKEYGYDEQTFIMIYIAEYIERKNHKFIIDSVSLLKKNIPDFKIILAGTGRLFEHMKDYAKFKQVDQYIDFLGFRTDIGNLIALSDIGISSSKQEGLGLNLAEEMYSGLPVIASDDRGHSELVDNNINGFIYPQNDIQQFTSAVVRLALNPNLRMDFGRNAQLKMKKLTLENVLIEMENIYNQYI